MPQVDLGVIRIFNERIDGESHIKVVIDCEPYLDSRYHQIEGIGEQFSDALSNLLEELEGIPD